jgi:hypothetical protein
MSEWKPIETAPRDGARILVWPFGDNGTIKMIWSDDLLDKPYWLDGVTHWMPLPEPPSVTLQKPKP